MNEKASLLRKNMEERIVGKGDVINKVMVALIAGGFDRSKEECINMKTSRHQKPYASSAFALILVLILTLAPSAVRTEVFASEGEYRAIFLSDGTVTTNENKNNYNTWASVVTSYLTEVSPGLLMRVERLSASKVLAEYMDLSGRVSSSRAIEGELGDFGGFFAGTDAYYLVFGQDNTDESDDLEVLRVVKYNKNWERLSACSISGINTTYPFDAGSLRMAETNGTLYIHTCHEMYRSEDGYNHQANMTFAVRENDMALLDQWSGVMNLGYGYVSHSFNQFIRTDGQYVYRVDHGDAHPRGISLTAFSVNSHVTNLSYYTIPVTFTGSVGANYTGASVGGYEFSDTSHLIACNMDADASARGTRNIYLAVVSKTTKETSLKAITAYTNDSTLTCATPQLIKLDGSRFLIMWKENDKTTGEGPLRLAIVNGEGDLISDIYSKPLKQSSCQPVLLSDGTVAWTVSDGKCTELYRIDPDNLAGIKACQGGHSFDEGLVTAEPTCTASGAKAYSCTECGATHTEVLPRLGHDYQVIGESGGDYTAACRRCGETTTGAALTAFKLYWRKAGETGSYWSVPPRDMEAGDSANYLVFDKTYSSTASLQFSDLLAEVSDPDNCIVDLEAEKVTFLREGTYTVLFYSALNRDVNRSYTFNVTKSLASASLSADKTAITYGESLRLSALVDGGKGDLIYSFLQIDPAGNRKPIRSNTASAECTFTPAMTGTYGLYVEVTDLDDNNKTILSDTLALKVLPAEVCVKEEVLVAAPLTYGQKLSELEVSNAEFVSVITGETVPGTLQIDHPDDILPAGDHVAAWTFVPEAAYYQTLTGTVAVTVNKAPAVILSEPEMPVVSYRPSLKVGDVAITGGDAVPAGRWEWEDATAPLSVPGGTYPIVFFPDDAANYDSATSQLTVTVMRADVCAAADVPQITYGQTLGDIVLTGTAVMAEDETVAVPGSFRIADGDARPAVSDSQVTLYEAVFIPEDTQSFNQAEVTFTVTVNKADRPAIMPAPEMNAPFSADVLTDALLEDAPGWHFAEEDLGTALTAGAAVTFTAYYTGQDQGNYLEETAAVCIFRSTCEHDGEREILNAAEPTCLEAGATGDEYCCLCGELLKASVLVPAYGHDFDEGTVVSGDLCTEEGYCVYTCRRCGETKEEVIAALGHALCEVSALEATCTEDGHLTHWICERCGRYFSDASGENEIPAEAVLVKATGHEFGEWTVTKEPTEEEEGSEMRTCLKDPDHTQVRAIPRTPHVHKLVKTKAKAATLKANGNTAYWTCPGCGKYFSDAEGKKPIKKNSWVIYKVGSVSLSKTSLPYTGKAQKPTVTVKDSKGNTVPGNYYSLTWSNKSSKNVGSYTVKVVLKDRYSGSKTLTYKITKAANTITNVKTKYSKTLSYSKKAQNVTTLAPKAKGKAKLTFSISAIKAGSKKIKTGFTVTSKGVVKADKKLAKGTYTVQVKITAKATTNYKAKTQTVTLKVKVR